MRDDHAHRRRTVWIGACLAGVLWLSVQAVMMSVLSGEAIADAVPASDHWDSYALATAVGTLVIALFAGVLLTRYDGGAGQVASAALVLVLVPQVVLAVEATLLWDAPDGESPLAPLAPEGSSWAAVAAGSLALWALAGLVVAALAHLVGSLLARRARAGAGA